MSDRLATVTDKEGNILSPQRPPPPLSARARRQSLNPSRKSRKVDRKKRYDNTKAAMTAAKQVKKDAQRAVRLKRSQAAAKKKTDAELVKVQATVNGTEPKAAVAEVKS